MSDESKLKNTIVMNNVPISWNEDGKGFNFFGIDSVLFWAKPSLISILCPLREELGEELYASIIAYEASKGTYEDYYAMVTGLGQDFQEGFLNWGKAVSTAGWGSFSVLSIDFESKEALIQIDDPWEMKIFKSEHHANDIPFLRGKISGIFGHAFQTNCKGEISHVSEAPNKVVLKISPTSETLEQTLIQLQDRRKLSEGNQLKIINSTLRRNEQRLDDVLETIGEQIWETDEHLVLVHISRHHTSNVLDTSALSQPLLKLIFTDDIPFFLQSCEKLKAGNSSLSEVKLRIQSSTGELFWTALKFKSLLDHSGKHSGFLGSARNIHKETLLEKEMEKQMAMTMHSSKMAELGTMAAGIAHELNNPLSEIIGMSWHLKKQHKEGKLDLNMLAPQLESMEKTSQRMGIIIKNMLAFSRMEQEEFCLCSMSKIIDDTLVFSQRRLVNHGVSLQVAPMKEDLKIDCKPVQLGQVILNLLNNAFDAISDLKEKWIHIEVLELAETIQFQIIDSGKGICKNTQDKIMEPFFTTKVTGKGTGLGLSVSRTIIEAHGGRLFHDPSSTNTKFTFEIPKKQK